jgi:UDP-N-acetylglucosamine 1-carboxyvinyltransferase
MDMIEVTGGKTLQGTVATSGAKNSALPILFSTLLCDGEHTFLNVPRLKDIFSTEELLKSLNCDVNFSENTFKVTVKEPKEYCAHYDYVRKMRASILCLGPLLAKYHEASVSLPGGCAIGSRPINIHLDGLKEMGAKIEVKGGYVYAKAPGGLNGARILFEVATVGGTENLMMAATLANGETVIENAAKEPEIIDLANYLVKMGAQIQGAGTSIIKIQGVKKLKPAIHEVIPDRIEAGTLLIAGAITGGHVKVTHCKPSHLEALISKLQESGFTIKANENELEVLPCDKWQGVDITTTPHPGFPTDLQAQFMALMTVAENTSVITESVFENRFMHVQELVRLNADITPKTRVAVVRGQKNLVAAPVMATDLRASACLILAGLVAEGTTQVKRIYHLDRGYENLEIKLASLGADIARVKEPV